MIKNKTNIIICMVLISFQVIFNYCLFDTVVSNQVSWCILQALLSIILWSLIHEGIHQNLLSDNRTNNVLARFLSILFGSNFIGLKYAHLAHHKYNRTHIERPDVKQDSINLIRGISFYFHILGGIYLKELILPILIFLPRKIIKKIQSNFKKDSIDFKVSNSILTDKKFNQYKIDSFLMYLFHIGSFYLFYTNDNVIFFIIFYLVRGITISLHDYSYHYGTKVDDVLFAKNLFMPFSFLILNFNYHGAHHKRPNTPWNELPKIENLDKKEFILWGILKQLKGLCRLNDLK